MRREITAPCPSASGTSVRTVTGATHLHTAGLVETRGAGPLGSIRAWRRDEPRRKQSGRAIALALRGCGRRHGLSTHARCAYRASTARASPRLGHLIAGDRRPGAGRCACVACRRTILCSASPCSRLRLRSRATIAPHLSWPSPTVLAGIKGALRALGASPPPLPLAWRRA